MVVCFLIISLTKSIETKIADFSNNEITKANNEDTYSQDVKPQLNNQNGYNQKKLTTNKKIFYQITTKYKVEDEEHEAMARDYEPPIEVCSFVGH